MEFFGELFFAYNQGTDETHGIITEYSDGALGFSSRLQIHLFWWVLQWTFAEEWGEICLAKIYL